MLRRILYNLNNQKGVTLTEIVIYIGILSVVSVGIISIITQLITMKHTSDSYGIITSEINNVFEKMIIDVRNADSFTVVDAHTMRIVNDGVTDEYHLSGSSIVFVDASGSYPLTTNQVQVESVTFSDWTSTNSDSLLHVDINLKRGTISEAFQTSIHVR
jgi:hypothetical protein